MQLVRVGRGHTHSQSWKRMAFGQGEGGEPSGQEMVEDGELIPLDKLGLRFYNG